MVRASSGRQAEVVYVSRYGLWITRFYEEQYWQVSQRGSNLTTEIRAGITTFLTAAYIMAVACPADVGIRGCSSLEDLCVWRACVCLGRVGLFRF